MSSQMTKANLRKEYLAKRAELSLEEWAQLNALLTLKLLEVIQSKGSKNVMVFLPIMDKNEFDCKPLARALWQQNIKTYVPVSNHTTHTMAPAVYGQDTQIVLKKYGIPEPISPQLINPSSIDLVIVPLLVADQNLHRVGYGGGFYDRFLAINQQVFKLGVSFFEVVHRILDAHALDVPLDRVVTPNSNP